MSYRQHFRRIGINWQVGSQYLDQWPCSNAWEYNSLGPLYLLNSTKITTPRSNCVHDLCWMKFVNHALTSTAGSFNHRYSWTWLSYYILPFYYMFLIIHSIISMLFELLFDVSKTVSGREAPTFIDTFCLTTLIYGWFIINTQAAYM